MLNYQIRSIRLLLLGLSIFVLAGCTFGRQQPANPVSISLPAQPSFDATQVLFQVAEGDVIDTRIFPGRVTLDREQDLFFGDNGRVHALYVESGDEILAGDLIAELDTRDLALDLELAENAVELAELKVTEGEAVLEIELENAQRTLDIAKLRLKAQEEVSDPDPITVEIQTIEVERAQSTVDRLKQGFGLTERADVAEMTSSLERAKIALRKLEAAFSDARIVAPFDGEVRLYEVLEEGKAIQAYVPAAAVVDPTTIRVDANLVSEDLSLLHEGMPVQVVLPSQPDAPISAQVTRLPQPFGTGTGTLTQISLSEDAAQLRPGMSVEIIAELSKAENTLWVPPDALHGFTENYYVELQRGAETVETPVKIGIRNNRQVQIVDGLQAGDQVIISQ